MGGGFSNPVVEPCYPAYFIKDPSISVEEIELAKISWNHILENTSPGYLQLVAKAASNESKEVPSSCLTWFYSKFYERLFDINPASRELFKNDINSQGKALMKMISACVSLIGKDDDSLKSALGRLARGHTVKGVVAPQYGVVGEVLLWTFDQCLGSAWNPPTMLAWMKIYSFMLAAIIPVALEEEKKLSTVVIPR